MMKKYWKSVVVLSFIIIGLSSYLIHSALLASELPRFELEHKSGDESLVDSMSVAGVYIDDKYHNAFDFDGEDTNYRSDSTFFEDMIGGYDPVKERLIDEYRDFMRGAPYLYQNYYDGDDALVIVEEDWNHRYNQMETDLKVSYLNKETEEEQKFTIDLEDGNYANVIEVQYVDGEIFVFSDHANSNERVLMEYVYDVESKQLISEKEILKSEGSNENEVDYSQINKLYESVPYQPMENLIFRAEEVEMEEFEEGLREVGREEKLFQYELKTGEITELDLPVEDYGYADRYDGQYIYFEQPNDENTISIRPYDLEKEEFQEEIEIVQHKIENENELDQSQHVEQLRPTIYEVRDQLLYTLENNSLKVIDVESGETVYEGEISSNDGIDMENVRFDDMRFE